MSNSSTLLETLWDLAIVAGVIVLAVAPLFWIARWILTPLDRAAKFRKAPVRFSIGDFFCLFLAIQIPLAAVYRFVGEDTVGAYWIFTIITWLIGPLIWYAGARTLSKAQVNTSSHRFVFLGLIMPLVYYGLLPFTALGMLLFGALFQPGDLPFRWLFLAWFILAVLFYASGRFVRWMLEQVHSDGRPISDREHEIVVLRTAMRDKSSLVLAGITMRGESHNR